jgi:hypothetical protein
MSYSIQRLRELIAPHDARLAKYGRADELLMQAARLDLVREDAFVEFQKHVRGSAIKALRFPRPEDTEVAGNSFSRLPEPIMQRIFDDALSGLVGRSLFCAVASLASVDKWMRAYVSRTTLRPAEMSWKAVKRTRPAAASEALAKSGTDNAYVLNSLVGSKGCMFCDLQPNVRKVHWKYWVRCCQPCLYARTIAEYYLKSDYMFDADDLAGIPSEDVELYRPRTGTFSCRFYWRADVVEFTKRRHGVDGLAAFRAMRLAEARELRLHRKRLETMCVDAGISAALLKTSAKYVQLHRHPCDVTPEDVSAVRDECLPAQMLLDEKAARERELDKAFASACKAAGITVADAKKHSTSYRGARARRDSRPETIAAINSEIARGLRGEQNERAFDALVLAHLGGVRPMHESATFCSYVKRVFAEFEESEFMALMPRIRREIEAARVERARAAREMAIGQRFRERRVCPFCHVPKGFLDHCRAVHPAFYATLLESDKDVVVHVNVASDGRVRVVLFSWW